MGAATPNEPIAIVLTALPVEMAAVLAHVGEERSADMAGSILCEIGYFRASNGLSWRVVAAELGPGNIDTASAVVALTSKYRPDVVMFVGIAGALKADVDVGDVVAGTEVAWTERGKWSEDSFAPRIRTVSLSPPLVQLARKVARDGTWTRRLRRQRAGVKAVVQQIASGEKVVADREYRAWLRVAFSDAFAIENEGFALARAAEAHAGGQRYVVRGISDLADGRKSDDRHEDAAEAAAAFAFELLDAYGSARDDVTVRATGQGWWEAAASRGSAGAGQLAHQPPLVAGRPVSLAPRPALLAGRANLLAVLHARLKADSGQEGPRIIALHGLGGAGKTSVAVEYAHQHLATAALVWQFPAEDRAVLAAEFARLATQLGASGGLLYPRDPVASVHAVLAASPAPWLLVFDNAPDQASVRAFLPPAGNGQILITSQSALWPPGQALEVPVLETHVAAVFLTARTGIADEQAAAELAVELGGLPLALEQAAAYIQAAGDNFVGYLASFRRRQRDMLSRGEPTGYGKTVATTWALAFTRLEQFEPGAAGLLRLSAFCAPEAIPLRLLLQPRPALGEELSPQVAEVLAPLLTDELAAKDAIAALRKYSLIGLGPGGTVSVHRLVQAVTANQVPAELARAWPSATAKVIEAAIPDDPKQPDTWPVFAALLPHAQAALPLHSEGIERIGSYLGHSRRYGAACELYKEIVKARGRILGPEHPHTLAARASLARWTGEAGDPAGACDQYAELLSVYEQVLGPEHPQVLKVHRHFAFWAGAAGDKNAAIQQSAALVRVHERALGPEHPDTLAARRGLADLTGGAGDPAAARDQFAELLPLCVRVLGREHQDTPWNMLAHWTGEAGEAAAARDQYAALIPIREQALGSPDHPDLLDDRAGLARWTGEAGDPAGARDQYAALVPLYKRVVGPENPRTLTALGNLARWTGTAGDPAAARDQYVALLPVRERVSGTGHPDTLTTRASLAHWTKRAHGGR